MDCNKIIEIYERACNKMFVLETTFLNPPSQITQIEFEKLRIEADKNCLESMITMYIL